MVATHKPAITVVIPTYNWSNALRCAIRSVLLQTMQDFEILVVGDGCTDDSAAVVAAFNDARIRWHNLEKNYGSQWFANNYGCENAAADWIAYLGHDDIWYPTHLEAILRAAREGSADIVTSTMILYWPEGTRGHGIAGVFATGRYGPQDFVPPSAFAHAKSIFGKVVRWRDPDTIATPMDAAFLEDMALTGRKLAATGELTCFKFNAAWRRDAYRNKRVDEQLRMLARIESGVDFRQTELLAVLESVVAQRFIHITAFPSATLAKGEGVRRGRRYKGLESRFENVPKHPVERLTRFDLADQDMPFEWHALETHPTYGTFRWMGPGPRATIDLPVLVDRDLAVRVHVIATLRPELADKIVLSVHGQPLPTQARRHGATLMLEAEVRAADLKDRDRDFGLTIDAVEVTRFCDVGLGEDRRWLGLAVNWVELVPL
jgi:hypothetical protein